MRGISLRTNAAQANRSMSGFVAVELLPRLARLTQWDWNRESLPKHTQQFPNEAGFLLSYDLEFSVI